MEERLWKKELRQLMHSKAVVEKIPENKLTSYRQKLTSAIVFKDYDRFCDILLQLSNYSDVSLTLHMTYLRILNKIKI